MHIIHSYTTTTVKRPNFKADYNSQYRQDPALFRELDSITDEKSVLLFLKRSPEVYNSVDEKGNHVIHYIVRKNLYETLKQMLINPQKAKTLLEMKGEEGKTPLAVATSEKVAKLLISKGANPYTLDDNFSPAGANSVLPQEFRDRIQKISDEKLKAAGTVPTKQAAPVETVTQPPKVDTEPLRVTAAETEYSKTVETPPPAEEKHVQYKQKKAFFSMFTSKPKAESEETKEVETAKPEAKPEETKEVETAKPEAKPAPVATEPKTKEKKEIVIKGTESFKRLDTPEIPGLNSVVGLEDIKNALKKCVVEPITNEDALTTLNENQTTIPNGILLVSPPGNGKTMLVKALGAEASMPVLEATSAADITRLVDIIGKNFDEKKQRAIIYMRGLDNLYTENSQSGELTNELLRTLNDTASRGALVVFSVECPENIPKSILSPGRVDRVFTFKSPDKITRLAFIADYISGKKLLEKVNIKEIADKTQGFSIAQIKHVIDDSVLNAATELNEFVTTSELLERIKQFSKEQNIPEINEYNKTSMYDTVLKRYQPTVYDAKDFESIAGMPATKRSVEESILRPWQNADKLRDAHIQLPAGGVFAGDPGTSKTYMAKALSGSLGIPLYILKMSDIGSSLVHETSKNIGRIIDQLITKFDETGEASILLMDEIDHFQKGQSQHGAEEVNTLLQEVERGRNKILFIGTTNEVESLPDSLTRDGRMGTVIHFEHCDENAAEAIIRNMLSERKGNPDAVEFLKNNEQLKVIAKRCSGMVAASISAIVNDALSDSIINNTKLEDAFDTAVKTRKKKDIEKMLSQNSKNVGQRLNITEDSTIMYDTRHPRMQMSETEPQKLDDLGGMDEVKSTLRSEIIEIYQPETLALLRENKLPITKGFILHGPPGNGKTTIIKALANEMGLPVYPLNTGNIGSSYIHQLARNAQEVREQLAYKFKMTGERSIVFMDEAQQLVPRTSGSMGMHQHNVEETNFFKDMIMTAQQDGIIYAMATNDLNQIEPAFYENADRLGVCVFVGNPDLQSRLGIIKKLLDDRPITKALNNPESIEMLAQWFDGFSISKISQSILNLVRNSIKTRTPITMENSVEFIRKIR